MKRASIALFALLGACGHDQQGLQVVYRPVPQPCATARPSPPVGLKDSTPNWQSMDVRQKAAAVGKWALEQKAYGENLNAATAACPEVK